MKPVLIGLALAALLTGPVISPGQDKPAQDGVITVDFTNPGVAISHWIITLRRDGSGHFHSEGGQTPPPNKTGMDATDEDRDIQLTPDFTRKVFSVAEEHNWFDEKCESRAKVAFQGWKKLSYVGPEGQGSCTYNYSQNKQIQALGDSLIGVAETLHEGARLELLLQHDRLGLDREMEFITDSAKDGRLRQISAIHDILQRLADDDQLLERVRKRARALLSQPDNRGE